ncbi:ABC transporter substrate-binding protein [Pelomonas sp. Root1444]|uniref:substrate-binding periplasmic protein n=1 Tax=Pelomonas sp. Root1444 TaxID=1736464 RepID=UPI000AAE7297|nr:transporter substrate-binding domain-containing protein [Pelomonas sp. Root1444]
MAAVSQPIRMLCGALAAVMFGGSAYGSSSPDTAPLTLRLARLEGVPDQRIGGEILKVAYARLGIQVQFVPVPALRSLLESSEGRVDGEVQRILLVETQYPTLIALRPSINFIEPSAFVKRLDFKVQGWPSVAPYRVGIVRGVGSSEAGTRGMRRVTAVASMEALMRMVAAERVDVAVNDRLSGALVLQQLGLESEVRPLDPPLQRVALYHFLHVKHQDLVPRVEEVLRGMAASGELEQLRARAVRDLLEQYGVRPLTPN